MWFPIALFLAHRAALMAVAAFGLRIVPALYSNVTAPFSEGDYPAAVRGLCRWDCGLYINLAAHGYRAASESPAFPLFPLVARVIAAVTGLAPLHAVLLAANLAGLGALIVVYRLFARLSGVASARAATALFVAFPFTYFHAAGYAESLTVFLAAGAMLLALDRRHVAAGLVLALGCATRHIALLATASLVLVAIEQRGWKPRALLWHRGALTWFLPPLGIAAYALFCEVRFGHPLAFAIWRTQCDSGFWRIRAWWSIAEAFRGGRLETEPLLATYVFWSLVPGIGAFALLTRRAWRPLAPYALLLMALYWKTSLMGLGRFSASCWPAFLPLGWWLSRRPGMASLAVVPLAMAQGFYFFLWSHWFGIY
jgi:Mannosyltransferase (PIG-V)